MAQFVFLYDTFSVKNPFSSGHQGMTFPLKKVTPSFWPAPPSKYEIVQAPLLLPPPPPHFMRKVLVNPPFLLQNLVL